MGCDELVISNSAYCYLLLLIIICSQWSNLFLLRSSEGRKHIKTFLASDSIYAECTRSSVYPSVTLEYQSKRLELGSQFSPYISPIHPSSFCGISFTQKL